MPEQTSIAKLKFILAVSQDFAQTRIMEQQPAVLIDDQERGRAEFQQFAKLTFVLGGLGSKSGTAIA